MGDGWQASPDITAPATDAAKQWEGWGTALKPAHEPIVVARKPLAGTVAANVLQHGTGALNIDGCRVGMSDADRQTIESATWIGRNLDRKAYGTYGTDGTDQAMTTHPAGRWPANVIINDSITDDWARYFYCAKPSKRERNAGLDGLPARKAGSLNMRTDSHAERNNQSTSNRQNHHPTVKPIALMRYLIRLVTPPDGTVLDPFTGSGTTLAAATLEGFNSIGIELIDEYLPIIEGRIRWAHQQTQPTLFET